MISRGYKATWINTSKKKHREKTKEIKYHRVLTDRKPQIERIPRDCHRELIHKDQHRVKILRDYYRESVHMGQPREMIVRDYRREGIHTEQHR